MKCKIFLTLFTILFLFCSLSTAFGQDDQTQASPIAFLPEPHYQFNPVVEGTDVVHSFVIQNKGTADLHVINVKTG